MKKSLIQHDITMNLFLNGVYWQKIPVTAVCMVWCSPIKTILPLFSACTVEMEGG